MNKELYERVLNLRNRISLDGDDTIYDEDYLLLDEALNYKKGGGKRWNKELNN